MSTKVTARRCVFKDVDENTKKTRPCDTKIALPSLYCRSHWNKIPVFIQTGIVNAVVDGETYVPGTKSRLMYLIDKANEALRGGDVTPVYEDPEPEDVPDEDENPGAT